MTNIFLENRLSPKLKHKITVFTLRVESRQRRESAVRRTRRMPSLSKDYVTINFRTFYKHYFSNGMSPCLKKLKKLKS